jgi:hypothetical protein
MSMLAACFRSADKDDAKPEESESESETNAEATSEDEATKQENKIESAKKAFEKELQNLDGVFKNNPDLSPEIAVVPPEVNLIPSPPSSPHSQSLHFPHSQSLLVWPLPTGGRSKSVSGPTVVC